MRDYSTGFFANPSTESAITTLASSESITIFAGAGLSLDQGLPSWLELTRALLSRQLLGRGLVRPDDIEAVTELLVRDLSEQTAATVIEGLYAEQFGRSDYRRRLSEDLTKAIYASRPLPVRRQSLAERTLMLAHSLRAAGRDVHLITTNYDDLLEHTASTARVSRRFSEWGIKCVPYATVAPRETSAYEIPLSHIHGSIPRPGSRNRMRSDPIFSETDYFRWEETSGFKSYLATRFSTGAHLIIGSSMRDWNILRRLYESATAHAPRFAIQPVASDAILKSDYRRYGINLAPLLEYRGSQLGVTVLRPNFYGQVYQFLDELRAAVTLTSSEGSDYDYYMKRLERWAKSWHETKYADDEARRTATIEANRLASSVVDGLPDCDHAKLEVWVRPGETAQRVLELWASSQSMWIADTNYWPKQQEISNLASGAAINAFAAGVATRGRVTPFQPDRWTHYVAAPVYITPGQSPLPVGVVTLLFHAPSHAGADLIPSVENELQEITNKLVRFGSAVLKA